MPSIITLAQRLLPARIKNFLKPYYRTLFPNRLHVVFLPTYRCNYRCSYCAVVTQHDFTTHFPAETERSAEEWLAAFAKLPPALIYIAGGEPLLYKGLPDFINNTKQTILGMVSNASVATSLYARIRKPIHLNLSFHREFVTEEKFLAKIEDLRFRFHVNVNVVATVENLPLIEEIAKRFRDRRVSLHVDPFVDPVGQFQYTPEQERLLAGVLEKDRQTYVKKQLDFGDYAPKRCSAGVNYINVMPDGDVYSCAGGATYTLSPLTQGVIQKRPDPSLPLPSYRLGNLFDQEFKLNKEPLICPLPCSAACDLDATIIRPLEPSSRKPLPIVS